VTGAGAQIIEIIRSNAKKIEDEVNSKNPDNNQNENTFANNYILTNPFFIANSTSPTRETTSNFLNRSSRYPSTVRWLNFIISAISF
jgi:hypothetical protein